MPNSRLAVRRTGLALAISFAAAIFSTAVGQAQTPYVGRFDLYTGFSDLNTPGLNNINQIGFHLQAGVTANRWLSYGFDYSTQNGSTHLTPGIATQALRQQLAAELPPGYSLNLPVDVTIQTFTAGGQLIFRKYHAATFFARPVLAAFHIRGTPHPNDPVNTLVAAQLAPQGYLTDWYGAYGAGGGVEFPVMKHLGARVQFDAGWNHPFDTILDHGGFSFRYSVGPAFHFGRNVPKAARK
ncbi:hypothetical protein [Terriglobus aquaticus]|uniref:Outer membrane protein beta-barrel domain-containing protein n=1 Tax=Terriglobus aquaticus TaxID=940139 RepID=A0ABW9KNU0_9BACT|nr:hypothetical protein [Terriglobus aquaticus]